MKNRTTRLIVSLAIFVLVGYFFYRIFSVEKKVFRSTSNDVDLSHNNANLNYGNMDSNSIKLEGIVAADSDLKKSPDLSALMDNKIDGTLDTEVNDKSADNKGPTLENDTNQDALSEISSALSAKLEDISGGLASGTATINRSKGLTHTIEADLPNIEENEFYEGWLVNKENDDFISTGKLSTNDDGYWLLNFSSNETMEGYDFVVVTLEETDDENPETHILEGLAK